MPVDFLGNELKENDIVIFIEPGYRNLITGTIKKITKKYAFIEYYTGVIWKKNVKQTFSQLIKNNR